MKKDNRHIQKDADDLLKGQLRSIFFKKGKRIGENPSKEGEEEGIDFFFEVFDGTSKQHDFFIFNQNKGTDETLVTIKRKGHEEKGKIAFQLDLKHVKYFYFELFESITFTLCDINNKIVYWYHIQNDSTIPKRIENQIKDGKQSLQIYIPQTNILNEENFNRFIDEVKEAKLNQVRKKYGAFIKTNTSNYSFIKEITKEKHIIDKLVYPIELFENFKSLPNNIIEQLYPFKENTKSIVYIDNFTLRTDNEELFSFFRSLEFKNGEHIINGKTVKSEATKKKLETILEFFKTNLITHIGWRGKEPKEVNRVCIHNLYESKSCNCERCNYENLNFEQTNKQLGKSHTTYSVYEKIRKGYAAFLVGNLQKATEIFYEVYKDYKDKKPIAYITAKYNLIQLKKIHSQQFIDNEEISKKLENIDYNTEELDIGNQAQHFLDIFKSIKDYNFFNSSLRHIDDLLQEINRTSYNDKHGGWTSNNKYLEFKTTFLRIYSFLEYNLLIFTYYSDYGVLTTKVLEGLFALYTIKNKNAVKYKAFDLFMLEIWIFHVKYEDAQFLLKKYNIDKIEVTEVLSVVEKFNLYLDNLIESVEYIESSDTMYFIFKVERILNNIVLILSRIKIKKEELNQVINKILDFSDKVEKPRFHPFGVLSSLLHHQEEVKNTNVERLIHLMEKHSLKISNFSYLIKYYVERSTGAEIEKFIFKLLKVDKFNKDLVKTENHRENYFRDLWYAYTFLNDKLKAELKEIITEYLNENFDAQLFDSACLFEIIDFDENLFDNLLETIPNQSEESNFHFMYPETNLRLDQAINLAFKLNIPFDGKLRKYASYSIENYRDYYNWIMDLEGFDYSKFDPYWLTGYHTKYYIDAFKKSKKLVSEIERSLKKDYIEGVAKAYFNKLI